MVKFKASELSDRNYREGDSVYIKYEIKRLNIAESNDIWLESKENSNHMWITTDFVLHGKEYQYRDGDIVNYNGNMAKVIRGFDNQWYVLNVHGIMLVLDPALITCIIKEENVL